MVKTHPIRKFDCWLNQLQQSNKTSSDWKPKGPFGFWLKHSGVASSMEDDHYIAM